MLNDNSWIRLNFIKNLRTFVFSYKKALDTLTQSLSKATIQLDKDFLKSNYEMAGQPQLIDTLSGAMGKVKSSMEGLVRSLNSRVEALDKDIVDPLDMYNRHYKQTTTDNLKEGSTFWNSIHAERTQMLFAKENYYNQMQNL